jgi:MFS family permease
MSSLSLLIFRCDDLIDSIGWGKYNTIVFWICGLGWAADNMWILLGTVLINEVGSDWNLSETEAGLIVTTMMFGFLIGSYMWGFLSDKYGRIFSFRKTLLLSGVCGIGVAASVNLPMLLIFALGAGIGVGGDLTVDGSVFVEFCPT